MWRVEYLQCAILLDDKIPQFFTSFSFFALLKVVEEIQQVEQVKKTEDVVPCPLCFKEFTCKSSLDTHMETHPEASLK